jgi:methionine sulfoxide reductase heme-binding subunit
MARSAAVGGQGLRAMLKVKAPWNERNGRFSWLKAIVWAGLFVPAAWIALLALTGALDPKVVTEMIHRTGQWAIRFLTLSLLVTPLMRSARYPKPVSIRRMVGVAAFFYAVAHLTLYVVDQHFDLPHVASEIARRFYLSIGFIAWLGLAALAATSTDGMIRRLGPRWRTLHSLVYGIAAVALLHFMIQAKADVSEPVRMTGFFLILMLFRVLVKRGAPAWGAALAAALVSPVLTALIEAAWYALVRHIDFWQVLEANVDPDMAFPPSAYVAAAGVAFLGVALVRRNPAPRRASFLAPSAQAGRVRT